MAVLRLQDPETGGIEETFGWSRWIDRNLVSIGLDGVSVPEPIAIAMGEAELSLWSALPAFAGEELSGMSPPKIVCYDEGWIAG